MAVKVSAPLALGMLCLASAAGAASPTACGPPIARGEIVVLDMTAAPAVSDDDVVRKHFGPYAVDWRETMVYAGSVGEVEHRAAGLGCDLVVLSRVTDAPLDHRSEGHSVLVSYGRRLGGEAAVDSTVRRRERSVEKLARRLPMRVGEGLVLFHVAMPSADAVEYRYWIDSPDLDLALAEGSEIGVGAVIEELASVHLEICKGVAGVTYLQLFFTRDGRLLGRYQFDGSVCSGA